MLDDCQNGEASLRRVVKMQGFIMRTTYYDDDDILVIHFSDKPVVCDVLADYSFCGQY